MERAVAEAKRKARRLVSHIEYEINMLRKQDNPESVIEKALKNLEERYIKGKIEITQDERNQIDQDIEREINIYPV